VNGAIILMGDGEVFYDAKTNDIKLLETSKTQYSKEELAAMKERIEAYFVKNKYTFSADGQTVLTTGMGKMVATFSVDKKTKHIIVTGKNNSGLTTGFRRRDIR
jgi:hypothetical protein